MDIFIPLVERKKNRRLSMKKLKYKKIQGILKVKTGLHIGSGKDTIEIGGMDLPIIRNPINMEPYIPGSSIKGKMRSLFEIKNNKINEKNNGPCNCEESECPVCRVFGRSGNIKHNGGPTRILVHDAFMNEQYSMIFDKDENRIVEEKWENTIDRKSGTAKHPRPLERVAPGVEFDFSITYRMLDLGEGFDLDEKYFNDVVIESLRLLQNDYLGGSGSRGSGRIEFKLKDENNNDIEL